MTDPRRWATPTAAAAMLAIAGAFLYLAVKIIEPEPLIDLDHFWYAGWLWNHGFNPYGNDFFRLRGAIFGARGVPPFFVYPPHFWIIAAPLASIDDAAARVLWGILNLGLLVGGVGLWWRVAHAWRQPATFQAGLLLFAACIMTGTGFALHAGQTSFVIWFAIALLGHGLTHRVRWQVALALTLVLLKPQFGLVILIAYAATYRDIRVLLAAGVMLAIASLPPVAIGGVESIKDFVRTINGWADFPFNRLSSMTGVGHLVAVVFHVDLSKQALVWTAAFGSTALLLIVGRQDRDRRFLAIVIAMLALFAPLHVYDLFFLLALPIILFPPQSLGGLIGTTIGLVLCLRPENLGTPFGLGEGPTIATLGIVVLVAASCLDGLWLGPRSKTPLLNMIARRAMSRHQATG